MTTFREASSKDLQPLTEELELPSRFDTLVGSDPAFRNALARAAKVARTHHNVVIEGEAGTGKKALLRSMHAASPRAHCRSATVRVRAFTAASIESALMGHERGAFLGAFDRQAGALEKSDGGTLLIEEINRLPLEVQEVLAQALTTGRVRPLGATHSLRVDTRVIATSNQPLAEMLDTGLLVPSLYEALSAYEIMVPPLRERRGDIPELAQDFLLNINKQLDDQEIVLSASALSLLSSYDWPGNARQLQAVLFRAAAGCVSGVLKSEHFTFLCSEEEGGVDDLSSPGSSGGGVLLFSDDGHLRSLEEIETDVIRFAVAHYGGRMTEVARRLGIGRSTLYRKISELNLQRVT